MNYNKIYEKLKAKRSSSNNIVSNSVSYGTSKFQRYENNPSTERRKRNIIDNVCNNLLLSNPNNISPYRKDSYAKNKGNYVSRIMENSNKSMMKATTARPKSVNIFKNC
jgi:hypothetical protein